VRFVPEAVVRCNANPEDMVGSLLHFLGEGRDVQINFLIGVKNSDFIH
jgi:hypothetical protein